MRTTTQDVTQGGQVLTAVAVNPFTEHTLVCTQCNRIARVTQQAIDEDRRENDWSSDQSDAEIAASLEFCLECVNGTKDPREHVGASIVHRSHGTLYDGPVSLVREVGGRIHEINDAVETVRARIAAKECAGCGRSLAHRIDYSPGQLCQRCDGDDDVGPSAWMAVWEGE